MRGRTIWSGPALLGLIDLSRKDPRQARRVVEAVLRLAGDRTGDIKKLQGSTGEYRLRVGDWRVIFEFESDAVSILRLDLRRDAYD